MYVALRVVQNATYKARVCLHLYTNSIHFDSRVTVKLSFRQYTIFI